MPDLPAPHPYDPEAGKRIAARMEREREAARKLRWETVGWGGVGVRWCELCGQYFDGAAYIHDSVFGRSYICTKCYGSLRRGRLRFFDIDKANLRDLRLVVGAVPRPCGVCGREFAWIGGDGFRRRPRPRLHICSDACRRERRNQARRVRHEEKRRCAGCPRSFLPTRADQVYHSHACRQRAYRTRMKLRQS